MRRWLLVIIALVVLVAVMYVFISPAVDLDPTITRAWQLAVLLLCCLLHLGQMIAVLFASWAPGTWSVCYSGQDVSPPSFARLSLAVLCSRLC